MARRGCEFSGFALPAAGAVGLMITGMEQADITVLIHINGSTFLRNRNSTTLSLAEALIKEGPRGEKREKVGNSTRGDKRGWVSEVLCAPLSLLPREDPGKQINVKMAVREHWVNRLFVVHHVSANPVRPVCYSNQESGGALMVSSDMPVQLDVWDTLFHENVAERGGAVSLRGQ
eukprot:3128880-Pyramimonas_sp.AAC.1